MQGIQPNRTVEEYLSLNAKQFVEFTNGRIEFLPYPAESHQILLGITAHRVCAFIESRALGITLFGPFPIKLGPETFREPDLAVMLGGHAGRRGNRYWDGADLVMEIVSPDDAERDWKQKREEYACAGIPEYWIIDSRSRIVMVFMLRNGKYVERVYEDGEQARSSLIEGLKLDVSTLFNSPETARASGAAAVSQP